MYKIGPKTRKGARSLLQEASADDPIYKRGFAVGMIRSMGSSRRVEEKPEDAPTRPEDEAQDQQNPGDKEDV